MGMISVTILFCFLLFAANFLGAKCSDLELVKSKFLAAKLKTFVSKMNEVILKLDSVGGCPKPSTVTTVATTVATTMVTIVEKPPVKVRPEGVCAISEKCPNKLPICTDQDREANKAWAKMAPKSMITKVHSLCGRKYDFHFGPVEVKDAMKYCCAVNLTLFSIDSFDELECIIEVYTREPKPAPKQIWTSGRADSTCSEGFSWCSHTASSNVGRFVKWKNGKPDPSKGQCVLLDFSDLNNVVLDNSKCSNKFRYICESDEF